MPSDSPALLPPEFVTGLKAILRDAAAELLRRPQGGATIYGVRRHGVEVSALVSAVFDTPRGGDAARWLRDQVFAFMDSAAETLLAPDRKQGTEERHLEAKAPEDLWGPGARPLMANVVLTVKPARAAGNAPEPLMPQEARGAIAALLPLARTVVTSRLDGLCDAILDGEAHLAGGMTMRSLPAEDLARSIAQDLSEGLRKHLRRLLADSTAWRSASPFLDEMQAIGHRTGCQPGEDLFHHALRLARRCEAAEAEAARLRQLLKEVADAHG